MDFLLYVVARLALALFQPMPLRWVASIGRCLGETAYWLDGRHRRVALDNFALAFPKMSQPERAALARENFRRLGENYASALKTAQMSFEELEPHLEFAGIESLLAESQQRRCQSRIIAIGHFGNFELYSRFGQNAPGFIRASTYRSLGGPRVNRLMESLRNRSGCRFYERRTGGKALLRDLRTEGFLLGLLVDQHAGRRGARLPFLGHECSTNTAPAVLARRYGYPLHTAICFRSGLARWRIVMGAEIPTQEEGKPRSIDAITLDINRALEQAVLCDPANWFWVHRRWKSPRQPK
jgi:KDO2-lipid IV(A) lauroyltransferase